jgi:hypothetical protein
VPEEAPATDPEEEGDLAEGAGSEDPAGDA